MLQDFTEGEATTGSFATHIEKLANFRDDTQKYAPYLEYVFCNFSRLPTKLSIYYYFQLT